VPVSPRWPIVLALALGALSCTETRTVEPQSIPEAGTRRIVLDLGLGPLADAGAAEPDEAVADALPDEALDSGDGAASDGAASDGAASDGAASDGAASDVDRGDVSLIDAEADDGQNEGE
jgi:hypothetical protein